MLIVVKSLDDTFDTTPPPTRYLIVISLLGAKPYSWVKNGVALLKLSKVLFIPGTNPSWMLSGLGNIVISEEFDRPAPNSNCNVPSDKKRDT